MFYFSSLSWCTERVCSSRSLRTKLGIWYPSRSSTMPYRKLRGFWISVRAPIKLLTDNSFCESKISCASQCLDQICAPKSMSSELLCRSKLWTHHCLFENLCCIATHCNWNTRSLVISASISSVPWKAAIIQSAPKYQPYYFCVWSFRQIHFEDFALLSIEFCVPATASEKRVLCQNTSLFAEIVGTSNGLLEITTSALGYAFTVFCYTAHVAQYCLMCPSRSAYIHGQYSCSERPAQSLMWQLNHLLFNMLLARLSVCPCQVQVRSQGSAELLQVANATSWMLNDLKTTSIMDDWAFPESQIHALFWIFHLEENMAAPEGIPCAPSLGPVWHV